VPCRPGEVIQYGTLGRNTAAGALSYDGRIVWLLTRSSYKKAGVNLCRHKGVASFVEAELGAVNSDGPSVQFLVARVKIILFGWGDQSRLSYE
jgi:hypothetical protein